MIVVTEIKVIDTNREVYLLPHFGKITYLAFDKLDCTKHGDISCNIEEIKGEDFINDKGEAVRIGMSLQAREAIGLQLGIYEKMHRSILRMEDVIDILQEKIISIKSKLNEYKSMSFWSRLKFLFNKKEPT